jgi:pilus assembly protein CpaE
VTVVDVDLQFGDVGLALGLRPERTIYDLARSAGSIDAEKLDAFLATHESGVRALLAPTRPDQAGAVTPELLATVYPVLRSMSDYVIVDTPPGFTPEVITSIDSSSDVCLVGMLDSLSLKNTKLGLETLELMGYDEDRTRLVLNRADSRVGISSSDVVEIVGRRPDVMVPSARDVTRSVNEGIPIVQAQPRSEAARAFRSLASLYGRPENGRSANGRGRRLKIGRR